MKPGVFASALLAAAFLHILEGLLPRIPLFPWLKLGISYAVVLPFLLRYGAAPAAALLVCRNALGWLLAGQAFSTFLIGTVSSSASLLVLGALVRFGLQRGWIGYLGAGVALAATQNLAQLAAVEFLFIRHGGFYFQLPAMLLWSAVSGAATAWLAVKATPSLNAAWDAADSSIPASASVVDGMSPIRRRGVFAVSWIRMILILTLPFLHVQIIMFVLGSAVLIFRRATPAERWKPFLPLLKAWPLILFLAWLHLFRGEGVLLAGGWVTHAGLEIFLLQALRLLNVILVGPRLAMAFPRGALFRSASPYFQGLGMAWERMPSLLAAWSNPASVFRKALRRGDVSPLLEKFLQGSDSSSLASRSAFSKSAAV